MCVWDGEHIRTHANLGWWATYKSCRIWERSYFDETQQCLKGKRSYAFALCWFYCYKIPASVTKSLCHRTLASSLNYCTEMPLFLPLNFNLNDKSRGRNGPTGSLMIAKTFCFDCSVLEIKYIHANIDNDYMHLPKSCLCYSTPPYCSSHRPAP